MSLDDLMNELAHVEPKEFLPYRYYCSDGDCVFSYLENVPFYGECVGLGLTLYRALDDDRTVGYEVDGVAKLVSSNE